MSSRDGLGFEGALIVWVRVRVGEAEGLGLE